MGQKGCYGYGQVVHEIKECQHARQGNRDVRSQTQSNSSPAPLGRPAPPRGASSSTSGGQCQNQFYAIPSHKEQEDSPDVVTDILHIFYFDVYVLLDPGLGFFYVTPLVAVNFEISSKKIPEPILVSTLVGESIVAKQIYKKCPTTILHKVMLADLIKLDMVNFNLILGMDWRHSYYASTNYRTRVVKF